MCISLVNGDWNIPKGTVLKISIQSHTGSTSLTSVAYNGSTQTSTGSPISINVAPGTHALVCSLDAKGQLDLVTVVGTCPNGSSTNLVATMTQTSSGTSVDLIGV